MMQNFPVLERILHSGAWRQIAWTAALIVSIVLLRAVIDAIARRAAGDGELHPEGARTHFWTKQATRIGAFIILVLGLIGIWVGDGAQFASIAGLITAGIAVALQRVIMSFAGYLVILRGGVFTVGDRITIGGVRGDVVSLGLMQTTVMEMGEPPTAQTGDPKVWVSARQYTGRIVKVTNDKIFDTPVYNYTKEFPFLWEEMVLPVRFEGDRDKAEQILLDVARRHTLGLAEKATPALSRLHRRYLIAERSSVEPRVYLRITDNWVELTLRFIAPVHGVRVLKDAMSREILDALQEAKIDIASGTYEIVGMPTLRVVQESER